MKRSVKLAAESPKELESRVQSLELSPGHNVIAALNHETELFGELDEPVIGPPEEK